MSLDNKINLGRGDGKWGFADCILLFKGFLWNSKKQVCAQVKPMNTAMNVAQARVSIPSNGSATKILNL